MPGDLGTTPELVVSTHTVVQPAREGRGAGRALVRAALDGVQGQGLAGLPPGAGGSLTFGASLATPSAVTTTRSPTCPGSR